MMQEEVMEQQAVSEMVKKLKNFARCLHEIDPDDKTIEILDKYPLGDMLPYIFVQSEEKKLGEIADLFYNPELLEKILMLAYKAVRKKGNNAEPIPLPKLPKPRRYISPNDKLMDALTEKEIINYKEGVNLTVLPKNGIQSYVLAIYEPDKKKDPFNLSPEERNIMDAICSIWQQSVLDGNTTAIMTPESIYSAMLGGGSRVTKDMHKKIIEFVNKAMDISITLDGTEQMMALGKIKPGEKYSKKTHMLLAEEHDYQRRNGEISIGWSLFQEPVSLECAKMTGQLVNVSAKVVRIEDVDNEKPNGIPVKMNESRRSLLAYLLRRVAVIKHAREKAAKKAAWSRNKATGKNWMELMEQSTTILFSSAFDASCIDTAKRNTTKALRDFCLDVMKYWKAIGYIPGFKELKDGRQRRGIKILFD